MGQDENGVKGGKGWGEAVADKGGGASKELQESSATRVQALEREHCSQERLCVTQQGAQGKKLPGIHYALELATTELNGTYLPWKVRSGPHAL